MDNENKAEFLNLYEPIHNQFCKFCRIISGNPIDAEDLIQDSILNLLENINKIKDLSAFKSYLFSIASNLHKTKLRRKKFKIEFQEDELNQIIDFGQNQEYLTDYKIIYEKILVLPQRTSETMILYHIADLSIEEIRNIQGGSLSGVKMRLKRGLEKLLSILNTEKQAKIAVMLFTI